MRISARFAIVGLAASALLACTAILGVDDLPPATDGPGSDGGAGGDATPNGVPVHLASSLSYIDQNIAFNQSQGKVTVGHATDESDVDRYVLYWGTTDTDKLQPPTPIATLPKTGDLSTMAPFAPDDAKRVLVYSANAAGEMATPVAAIVSDNHPTFVSLSTSVARSGFYPSVTIDEVAKHLLVATESDAVAGDAGSSSAVLVTSDLDGQGAASLNLAAAALVDAGNGQTPSIVIDTAHAKALIVTRALQDKPGLFRCTTSGAPCNFEELAGAGGPGSGTQPVALVEPKAQKLLVVTQDSSLNRMLSLFRCDIDGTNCTQTNVSSVAQQGNDSGQRPAALLDDVANPGGGSQPELVVGTKTSTGIGLFHCSTDGLECTFHDITSGLTIGSGFGTSVVLDHANAMVDFVTDVSGGKYALVRCNAIGDVGTNCTAKTLAISTPPTVTMRVSAAIDALDAKLYIAYASSPSVLPTVARCELDGSLCAAIDLSSGQGSNSGTNPVAIIDNINRKLLVVTDNGAAGHTSGLFSFGLW